MHEHTEARKSQIDEIKEELRQAQQAQQRELQALRSQLNFEREADPSDRGTQDEEAERVRGRMRIIDGHLRAISTALMRIQWGTYGVCQGPDCGIDIPIERLRAAQCTTLCGDCARTQDVRSRQTNVMAPAW